MSPSPDPLAAFLGFSLEVASAEPAPAAPEGVRGPPPENTASMLADARLRGLIRKIIEERGMAVTVIMVQRALHEASRDAVASGRSPQGYIG